MKMPFNWIAVLVSGLIPLVVGFIWYNPKVFGKAWMEASGMTEEKAQGANMPLIFGLSLLFGMMIAVALVPVVIHQVHIYSALMKEPGFGKAGSTIMVYIANFMKDYGGSFRTFQHGAFHGAVNGLFVILPVIATNALYERKGFKYIAINAGFWTVCLALMGGLICVWR